MPQEQYDSAMSICPAEEDADMGSAEFLAVSLFAAACFLLYKLSENGLTILLIVVLGAAAFMIAAGMADGFAPISRTPLVTPSFQIIQ